MTALMSGRYNGFSLLELLVVMFLLGIMATFGLQIVRSIRPVDKQEKFVDNVRTLLAISWQQALTSGKVHRIYFDLKKRIMMAEMQTNDPRDDKEIFGLVTRTYDATQFTWPATITFKQFYIQGTEQLHKPGVKTDAIWFYIVPDGMVQEVIMNIEETIDEYQVPLSLVINPFTAQLTTYDTFQKP